MTLSRFSFVSMTYNVWGDWRVEERMPALQALLERRPPDLLATQELRPASRAAIDEALPGHERIRDDSPGWSRQSNLWWRTDLFEALDYGAEDVGIRAEHASLFWVRLQPRADEPVGPLVFSTAHLTWPGHPQEREDDVNPRVDQARRIVGELDRLAGEGAAIFAVDINDYARPLWVLSEAGFSESFGALGQASPVTHPVVPLTLPGDRPHGVAAVAKAIDWQFHRGPVRARSSEVVDFFHHGVAPSDHKPVVATFTLTSDAAKP